MEQTLPRGWAAATLGALSQFITSGSRDWSSYYAATGSLFIRTQDINKNRIGDLDSVARVSLPSSVEGKRSLVLQDDLLVTITGANVGRCAHVAAQLPEAYVSQSVALVRLQLPSLARFVHYQLLAPPDSGEQTWLEANAYGMGRPVLSLENVRSVPLRIAPVAEQQRIADKLDTVLARVDACRDRLARVAPLLKRFRQSVLAAATSGRLTQDWRAGTSGDEQMPVGWVHSSVRAVTTDIRYGTAKKCAYQLNGVGVLRIPNISETGAIDITDLKRAEFSDSEVESFRLRQGDLLVIRSNGSVDLVGRTAVVAEREAGLLFAGYLIRLRVASTLIRPAFLYLCLSEPKQRARIESTAKSTSGVNNINAEELLGLTLRLPPVQEQAEIIRRVETLFAFADRLEARLAQAQTAVDRLTPSLLAKAFRGELVPQDPADEPAAELLQRLAAQREAAPARTRRPRTLA